jgi:hypothetical protein
MNKTLGNGLVALLVLSLVLIYGIIVSNPSAAESPMLSMIIRGLVGGSLVLTIVLIWVVTKDSDSSTQ